MPDYTKLVRKAVEAVQGIRAYHGSPHDFERFDLSKIGTGEGAQVFGHGLYFAENPEVARTYRNALSAPEVSVQTKYKAIDATAHPDTDIRAAGRMIADEGSLDAAMERARKATN